MSYRRPALRKADSLRQKKIESRQRRAEKKDREEIMFNSLLSGKFMAESDLRELLVLLFIRIHRRASDKILRRTFLFMDLYMPKIITKFLDDGMLTKAKDPNYMRLWFF